jgi:hypothetical protein
MIKNGAITISEPGFPEKEWKKTVPDIEAIIKTATNINTGIL